LLTSTYGPDIKWEKLTAMLNLVHVHESALVPCVGLDKSLSSNSGERLYGDHADSHSQVQHGESAENKAVLNARQPTVVYIRCYCLSKAE